MFELCFCLEGLWSVFAQKQWNISDKPILYRKIIQFSTVKFTEIFLKFSISNVFLNLLQNLYNKFGCHLNLSNSQLMVFAMQNRFIPYTVNGIWYTVYHTLSDAYSDAFPMPTAPCGIRTNWPSGRRTPWSRSQTFFIVKNTIAAIFKSLIIFSPGHVERFNSQNYT